ncbi:MAG: YjbQ family protein [Pseudomonadota bacterium]
MIFLKKIYISTKAEVQIISVMSDISIAIRESEATDGLVTLWLPEFGAAVVAGANIEDFKSSLIDLIKRLPVQNPETLTKKKEKVELFPLLAQASFGSSMSLPFEAGKLILPLEREIFVVDFENVSKRREVVIQIMSETPAKPQEEQEYY